MAKFHFLVSVRPSVCSEGFWLAKDRPEAPGRSVEVTLTNCLRSLDNQSHPSYRVHLACHDLPFINVDLFHNITVHRADFPLPTEIDLETYNRLGCKNCEGHALEKLPDLHRKQMGDKYSKIKLGLASALDDPEAEFVMFMDADDMVHRDFVRCVLEEPSKAPGYSMTVGYTYCAGDYQLRDLVPYWRTCGSCNAIRLMDWEKEAWNRTRDVCQAFSPTWKDRQNHWLFAGHEIMRSVMKKAGRPMAEIMFPAGIYVTDTGVNHSGNKRRGSRQVPWTEGIRAAFGYPVRPGVDPAWSHFGSLGLEV